MPSPAFYATDFKVFDEQGFRARMGAIGRDKGLSIRTWSRAEHGRHGQRG